MVCNDWFKVSKLLWLRFIICPAPAAVFCMLCKQMNEPCHFCRAFLTKGACEKKLEVGKVPEGGKCTYRVTVHTSGECLN